MEDVTIDHAKEHLDELVARARRGEDVRIVASDGVSVKLQPVEERTKDGDRTARVPGRWKDRLGSEPPGFFDPLSEEELKDWYGDDK